MHRHCLVVGSLLGGVVLASIVPELGENRSPLEAKWICRKAQPPAKDPGRWPAAQEISLSTSQKALQEESVALLNSYPDFKNTTLVDGPEPWTCSGVTDPNLRKLARDCGVREIMGEGSEINRILRLMDWVHRKLGREGKLGKPDTLNTLSILDLVENGGYAVNCRLKAIVLTELLLTQGIPARRISCRPARFDGDSHVIVMTFSRELQKWICVDPTFNTFFFDEDGTILNFAEMRDSYRSGRIPKFRSITLPMNAAMALSGVRFETYDSWYSVYMAKNCFSASSPLKSAFGYESSPSPEWVWLIPGGYHPEEMGYSDSAGGGSYTVEKTIEDLSYFLRKP